MSEIVNNELKPALAERALNPVFTSYLLSLIACNWRAFSALFLAMGQPFNDRIDYVESLYTNGWSIFGYMIVGPIGGVVLYLIVFRALSALYAVHIAHKIEDFVQSDRISLLKERYQYAEHGENLITFESLLNSYMDKRCTELKESLLRKYNKTYDHIILSKEQVERLQNNLYESIKDDINEAIQPLIASSKKAEIAYKNALLNSLNHKEE